MIDRQLTGLRVAAIVADGFEEVELTEPLKALRDAGAHVDILSIKPGKVQAFRHHEKSIQVDVDRTIDEVQPAEYHALLLPGALNADVSRNHPKIQALVRMMNAAKKPIAAICHAPWILISAGIMSGRKLTSYETIRDDVRNAGGNWVDEEVLVDENWITSRKTDDIPAFNRETHRIFARTAALVRSLNATLAAAA